MVPIALAPTCQSSALACLGFLMMAEQMSSLAQKKRKTRKNTASESLESKTIADLSGKSYK